MTFWFLCIDHSYHFYFVSKDELRKKKKGHYVLVPKNYIITQICVVFHQNILEFEFENPVVSFKFKNPFKS